MPRTDLALALLLASATALSRIPFRARLLPTWDAVQFALALREYDIVKHQPHPPGYILYVAVARGIEAVLADPAASLTWLAVGASAVTVLLVYRLAWRLYGRATAAIAAVGLAASPLFWYYGVVALPYAVEAALATAVAALAWPMREGQARFAVWSALALGVAGGVRQSMLLLLLPLWLGMAWAGLRRWPPILAGGAVMAVTAAAWFGPMVWLTGGLDRYLGAAGDLFDSTIRATTILGPPGRWQVNVIGLLEALLLGIGLFLPALVWLTARGVRRASMGDARAELFAAWVVPPLGVYTLGHFGQHGYLLTVLPALYIVTARGLVAASSRLAGVLRGPALRRGVTAALVGGIGLVHAAFFVKAAPVHVPEVAPDVSGLDRWAADLRGRYRYRLWAKTGEGLREQDAVIRAYVDVLRRDFDPTDTVLVTELGNPRSYPWFRHATYYLPEFTVYHLRLGAFSAGYLSSQRAGAMTALAGPDIFLPSSARRLVWVVDHWNPTVPRPPGLRPHPLPHGRWLYVLDVGRRPVEHAGYRLTPLTALARPR